MAFNSNAANLINLVLLIYILFIHVLWVFFILKYQEQYNIKSLFGVLPVSQFFSDTSQGEFDDTEILHLQERASRLLLREYEDLQVTLMIN